MKVILRRAILIATAAVLVLASVCTVRYLQTGERALPAGVARVPREQLPGPGEPPLRVSEARAWVVHLSPGEGNWRRRGVPARSAGYLALAVKSPYRDCSIPWLAQFDFRGQRGWFRDPCHGGTFTESGVRVAGPKSRSRDTFVIEFDENGDLLIDTRKVVPGGDDNALRAQAAGDEG